jgi:hypothetical protein
MAHGLFNLARRYFLNISACAADVTCVTWHQPKPKEQPINIFVLDTDPEIAARIQCDKHVVKMVLESVQMLCTAHHTNGLPHCAADAIYKPSYIKHPCTLWASQTTSNYRWLYDHAKALSSEYTRRYHKFHKSARLLALLGKNPCRIGELTPFAQAMPDQYKNTDAVQAYQDYYLLDKFTNIKMTWKNCKPPHFIANELHDAKL